MEKSHFERMMNLIEESFSTRHDPEQLNVDEGVMERLQQIHPFTLSEYDDGGPAVWILLIPTSESVMNKFLRHEISEKQLYELTHPGESYHAVYLCSASVLPEYRRKGLAQGLCLDAIKNIRKDHAISTLYVWPFSREGESLAENIANRCGLPLLKRK